MDGNKPIINPISSRTVAIATVYILNTFVSELLQ